MINSIVHIFFYVKQLEHYYYMTTININQVNNELDTILNDIEKLRININKLKIEYNNTNDSKVQNINFDEINKYIDNKINSTVQTIVKSIIKLVKF